jgi:hypothetical protein
MQQKQQVSRLGMFTASSIYKLLGKGRGADKPFSDTALTYIEEKLAEIITGEHQEQFTNKAMAWGNEHEYDAAQWLKQNYFEFEYYGKLNFVFNEYNEYSGASPDGLSNDCVVELKCPFNSSNHIGFLIASVSDDAASWVKSNYPEYYAQVQFNMMCAKLDKSVLASYDPRTVEPKYRMAVINIPKDEDYCKILDERISMAVEVIKVRLAELTKCDF